MWKLITFKRFLGICIITMSASIMAFEPVLDPTADNEDDMLFADFDSVFSASKYEQKITEAINPEKDVDGFHPVSLGKMLLHLPSFLPATPYGITEMLKHYNIPTEGKHCVVLGRSHIVGSPMSVLMARKGYPGNSTVTLAHSRTQNLADFTRAADILIVALGRPEFVTADMVKEGAVVIDVGISRVDADTPRGYVLKGDVNFDDVAPKASYITPVPGGVGPMTIVGLMQNTLKAFRRKHG